MVEGEGNPELRLGDGVNKPMLVLGQTNPVPSVTCSNIHVSGLRLDGNRVNQKQETDPANAALRNNCISLRRVVDCSVQNVAVHSARSGGLVTELGCRRILVSDFELYGNQFDGLAGYETEDSVFKCLKLHDNLAAGLSFDIDFVKNVVTDSVLSGNGSVGIFMRDSRDNVLSNLQIRGSAQHGIFLAQVDTDTNTPASGNTFIGCVIANSGGAGLRVNNDSCTSNILSASQLIGNAAGFSESTPGLLNVSAVITR